MKPSLNMLAIEVTKLCDMKCVMCVSHGEGLYQGQADDQPPFLDIDFFKSIVNQYVDLQPLDRSVLPQFQGEPLLNPRFLEYCEILERSRTPFGFTTNGSKMTEVLAKELVKFESFRNICFSIDGASKGVYESIRILGRYDTVIPNIDRFLEIAQRAKPLRRTPLDTQVNFTEQPLNEHESEQIVRQWVDKVDFVSINNVAVNGRPTRFFFQPAERIPCGDLWSYMVILTDGKVVPCCRDYLYEFGIGNLHEKSLKDIWLGAEYKRLRELHLAKRWDEIPICNDCDTWMCRVEQRQKSVVDHTIQVEKGPFFRSARRGSDLFDSLVILARPDWRMGAGDSCQSVALELSRALPVHIVIPDLDDELRMVPEPCSMSRISIIHVGKSHSAAQRQAISLHMTTGKIRKPLLWAFNPDFVDFVAGCYSPQKVFHATGAGADTGAATDTATGNTALNRLLGKVDLLVCDTGPDLERFTALHAYRGECEAMDRVALPQPAGPSAREIVRHAVRLKPAAVSATSTKA